jgi:hypothetical protein
MGLSNFAQRITKANEDYKSENARLTKELESKHMSPLSHRPCILLNILLTSLQLTELKAMVENVVSFFYPNDSSSAARAPQFLDGLLSRSREVILTNMKQSTRLTLGILKTLYPEADFDAAGEGFAMACTNEDARKLMEYSTLTAGRILEMLPLDMS